MSHALRKRCLMHHRSDLPSIGTTRALYSCIKPKSSGGINRFLLESLEDSWVSLIPQLLISGLDTRWILRTREDDLISAPRRRLQDEIVATTKANSGYEQGKKRTALSDTTNHSISRSIYCAPYWLSLPAICETITAR